MNFKKIAIAAALTAATSAVFAAEGFYAGVGVAAVGSDFNRTSIEDGIALSTGQTNTIGIVDLGYATQVNKDWGVGVGVTLDLNKTKAGSVNINDNIDYAKSLSFQAKNHYSIYVQPYFNLNANTALFGKVGYHSIKGEIYDADVAGNESMTFRGMGYGFGLKTMLNKNVYMQAEVMWVDYKSKSDANDENKLKTTSGIVSLGYQF